jgi:hypothetical protein
MLGGRDRAGGKPGAVTAPYACEGRGAFDTDLAERIAAGLASRIGGEPLDDERAELRATVLLQEMPAPLDQPRRRATDG